MAHPTAVLGTRADLLSLRPLLLSLCDPPPSFAPGSHRVSGADRDGLQVQSLTLGTALPSATEPTRTTTVRRWDAEHRLVDVGAGGQTYLVVHENANRGWRAQLDGQALRPVRLDGWQQAWVVPAGAGGAVHLDFLPGRTFHLALLFGGLLVLVLLALALIPSRARERDQASDLNLPVAVRALLALGTCVLLGGLAGAACYLVVVAVAVLAKAHARDGLVGIYGAALSLAGVLTAIAPWNGSRAPAALGMPVQLLALVGVACVAAAVSVLPSPSAASAPVPGAPPPAG